MLSFLDPTAEYMKRGLAWAVPAELFEPGIPWRRPPVLRIDCLPIAVDTLPGLKRGAGAKTAVHVELSPGLGFRRLVSVPQAAKAEKERIVALQLKETLPNNAQGLDWRILDERRDEKRLVLDVLVFRAEIASEVQHALRDFGLHAERIFFTGCAGMPILPDPQRSRRKLHRTIAIAASLVGLSAMVEVAALEHATARLLRQYADLDGQVQEAQTRLDSLIQVSASGEPDDGQLSADLSIFETTAFPLTFLADLTATLPDTVWVPELSLDPQGLHLSGFASGNVAEVVSRLNGLPWVSGVEISGPAVVDPVSNQTRFELNLKLRPPL